MKQPPENFVLECSTVWSFPRRGAWATHKSTYRGNWSPEVVRNLIIRYSSEGDTLLDCMIGGGTTAIECKLLHRNLYAYDINPQALERTSASLDFSCDSPSKIVLACRDARETNPDLANESIDFVLTHPPYVDIIRYSENIAGDMSHIHDIDLFCQEIKKVADEAFRVLRPGRFCAILIGDTRRKGLYQPLAYKVMEVFLAAGFALKEDIIKQQHNCQATGFWRTSSQKHNFLLIMHEHLFIFKKI